MRIKKRTIKIFILSISILALAVFVPWNAVRLWITPLPDNVQEQVDAAVNYGLNGIIVYVDSKDKTSVSYAAGLDDRAKKTPLNPHALFKIASISKLYIATAAAKMVNAKTLILDKTLADYLPEIAGKIKYADQITLRMLLQHRSGIPDFINVPDMPWADLPADQDAFLQLVLNKDADFKPDADYRYSNTNYLLIGRIMDKVLGYSHGDYIKMEILEPLKLKNTFGLLNEVDQRKLASGYYTEYDGDLKTQNFVVAGGSMVATAEDVGIFLRALNDGTLLNADEQAIYTKLYKYEHTGLLPGYSSIARYYKDPDQVVVVFVNTSGGNTWTTVEMISDRIVKILRKKSKL